MHLTLSEARTSQKRITLPLQLYAKRIWTSMGINPVTPDCVASKKTLLPTKSLCSEEFSFKAPYLLIFFFFRRRISTCFFFRRLTRVLMRCMRRGVFFLPHLCSGFGLWIGGGNVVMEGDGKSRLFRSGKEIG